MRLTAVAALSLIVCSCGVRSGFLRDAHTLQQIDIRMEVSQVRYLRSASGDAGVGLLFCTIPLGDTMYRAAMQDLMDDAKLGPNEILVNLREDHAFTTWFGVFCREKVTISADVMALTASGSAPAPAVPILPPAPPLPGKLN
jgi:hypothetical protein